MSEKIGSSPSPKKMSVKISPSTFGMTLGVTSVKVLPRKNNRSYLLVQNRSAGSVFFSFSSIDDNNFNCHEIIPGGNFEPNTNGLLVLGGDIYMKAAIANSNIAITEGIVNEN